MSKRLLMIAGYSATDVARGKHNAFYETLLELHKHFDAVDVISPGGRWFIRNVNQANLLGNVRIFPSRWPLWLYIIWARAKAYRLHEVSQYNWITVLEHAPFYNGIAGRIISKILGVPYMLEIHHITGLPLASNMKEKIYRFLSIIFFRFSARKAHTVRVVNKIQTRRYLIKIGIDDRKIKYIPSFYIDHGIFKPSFAEKQYDVIFVGRLAENKGLNLLIEAMRYNLGQLLIVGQGRLESFLKKRVNLLGLTNRVIFRGWVANQSEIAALINMSKVLVIPSYSEGGPRVALEAMACGVPVIGTRVGILEDIAKELPGAITICSWDKFDMAEKIKKLIEDRNFAENQAKEGIKYAAQFKKAELVANYALAIKEMK